MQHFPKSQEFSPSLYKKVFLLLLTYGGEFDGEDCGALQA